MRKIVIASDSFKGSISSQEIAGVIEETVKRIMPDCSVHKLAMADGGEGSIFAIRNMIETRTVYAETVDPLFRKIRSKYLITPDNRAIIELASSSGITLLEKEELNPMKTSTFGTGLLIADALKHGCREITLTLGGSATNDAGTGILNALGIVFRDKDGKSVICNGEGLNLITGINPSQIMPEAEEAVFTLACDVTNPLFGNEGAAYVFAGQKGADKEMIEQLDRGLRNINMVFAAHTGKDISAIPGAGAAGGTAGGIMAMLKANIVSGAEFILQITRFDEIIKDADLVITGEGSIDRQTLGGKLPYVVATHARSRNIPVLAICGRCKEDICGLTGLPFEIMEVSPRYIPLVEAMKKENAARFIAKSIENYLNGKIRTQA